MDDFDAYDTASQYGQGLDDTASVISGYTVRTQRTATTGILLEESESDLDLLNDNFNNITIPGSNGLAVPKTILEDELFDGVLEESEPKDFFDGDEQADLPPHACRYVHRSLRRYAGLALNFFTPLATVVSILLLRS